MTQAINLVSAIILILIALFFGFASEQFFQIWLGSDVLWGQGQWGTVSQKINEQPMGYEYLITEHGQGRALLIRILAVTIPAVAALPFMLAWKRHRANSTA